MDTDTALDMDDDEYETCHPPTARSLFDERRRRLEALRGRCGAA
jgi:hypothetical protein